MFLYVPLIFNFNETKLNYIDHNQKFLPKRI